MSNVTDNVMLMFNKGGFAKTLVYRTIKGKTYTCKYPDMSNIVPSNSQTKGRERFAKAIEYGRLVMKDPELKAAYGAMGKHSAFHAAVRECLLKWKADDAAFNKGEGAIQNALKELLLDERLIEAALYIKRYKQLTNGIYQEINKVSKPTATRHLQQMVRLNLIQPNGVKGAGSHYIMGSWWGEQ